MASIPNTHFTGRVTHTHMHQYKANVIKMKLILTFFTGIDCDVLEDIANGYVDFGKTSFGSTATYNCNSGFVLVGKGLRRCSEDGQWSGVEPSCESKLMGPLLLHVLLNV